MDALKYILYDNSLQKPEADSDTGEPGSSKTPFPGQAALVARLKEVFLEITGNASDLELSGEKSPIKRIKFRYSGSGNTSFGGIDEDVWDGFDKGHVMIITIVANSKDAGVYRWREVLQKPKTQNPDGSWSYSKELLTGDPESEETCVNEIFNHIVKKLGGHQ